MKGQTFWWLLTLACLLWYTGITVYVAIRGLFDIRAMLRRLREGGDERSSTGGQR